MTSRSPSDRPGSLRPSKPSVDQSAVKCNVDSKPDGNAVVSKRAAPESYEIEEAAQRTQIERRRHQMYPNLSDARVEKVKRFGRIEHWNAGEVICRTGERSEGMRVLLRGQVNLIVRDGLGRSQVFQEVMERQFLGETATLSGKPYLVDAIAITDVEAILVSPEQLRALLIAEAQLGSEIMRAFILRRVALIQDGSGPILIGSPTSPKLLALADLLRRVNHPHRVMDPTSDGETPASLAKLPLCGDDVINVILVDGTILEDPSEIEVCSALGYFAASTSP